MEVTRTSIKSGITRTLNLDVYPHELAAWEAGELIQVACPRLGTDAREFIKTGMTPREWQEVFPPEEGE